MDKNKIIQGKSISSWMEEFPIMDDIASLKETAWVNKDIQNAEKAIKECEVTLDDVHDAEARLKRFAAYLRIAFPETAASGGIIESPVKAIPEMKKVLEKEYSTQIPGELWIKLDSHLPISGSIKARGGIYEVLKFAEDIALKEGILKDGDSYEVFDSDEFRRVFSSYSIAVGSTGNLGLSIGIMSAKLGFKVTVHMSSDAREWKKAMLRSKGVTVVEYDSDYSIAVANGRVEAANDPYCHFVDDENSKTLFLGYAVAALRLKKQLEEAGLTVDKNHPMFVYLPCGVGGGPGGVAFGLKLVYKDAVHCYFAEPTHSCCMLLGLSTGLNDSISTQDIGVDNHTVADGLAVGRPSSFVGRIMKPFMSGCYSLEDDRMFRLLAQIADSESIRLEPSALAGMYGPILLSSTESKLYPSLENEGISESAMLSATHLVWATGGSMVPSDEMEKYYNKGKSLLQLKN